MHLLLLLVRDRHAAQHLHRPVQVVFVALIKGHVLIPVLLGSEQTVPILELDLAGVQSEAFDRERDPGESAKDVVQHQVVAEHGD